MAQKINFRVMSYNLHLYGDAVVFGGLAGLVYCDEERANEIIKAIRNEPSQPDVIGLCEVWDENIAKLIIDGLKDIYPHSIVGPIRETASLLGLFVAPFFFLNHFLAFAVAAAYFFFVRRGNALGSGLLLLSKSKISRSAFCSYSAESGVDAFAEKGVLLAEVEVPGEHVIVAMTHLQAPAADVDIRRDQLYGLVSGCVQFQNENQRAPLIIMGDMNIIGNIPNQQDDIIRSEYESMMSILSMNMVDSWKEINPNDSGFTTNSDENPLSDYFSSSEPIRKKRLDYIFYQSETSYYVHTEAVSCRILKYQSDAGIGDDNYRNLSDHYGLLAEFSIEFRTFATITYHIDSTNLPVDIETPALRSILAWMEETATGFNEVDSAVELPLLRIGFVDSQHFEDDTAVVERLGRVSLNPAPGPFNWGLGYRAIPPIQLDLSYTLQHHIGRALHSLSPESVGVSKELDENNAMPNSVMLPYMRDRELSLVDENNEPNADHLRHLTESDIDYITELYGKRDKPIDWKAKARALQDDTIIKQILESGLTGTEGALARNIAAIETQIGRVQARIPINARVHVMKVVWYGGINDIGCCEDEEVRFIMKGFNGYGYQFRREFPQPPHEHKVTTNAPSYIIRDWWDYGYMTGVIPAAFLDMGVIELDAGMNGCNKDYIRPVPIPGIEQAIKTMRLPNGPDGMQLRIPRIDFPGKWWADIIIDLEVPSAKKTDVLIPLQNQLNVARQLQVEMTNNFSSGLADNIGEELGNVMGGFRT